MSRKPKQDFAKTAAPSNDNQEKEKRTAYVRARVLPSQKKKLLQLCKEANLDEADYIRKKLFRSAPLKPAHTPHGKSARDMVQLLHYASKSSNNINQIAHALNKALLRSDYTAGRVVDILNKNSSTIEEIKYYVLEIRNMLREELLSGDTRRLNH